MRSSRRDQLCRELFAYFLSTQKVWREAQGTWITETTVLAISYNEVMTNSKLKIGTKKIFALVDCNNFFVSCERLFRPDLADKPVVVLSSNDGCAVSRSNEAKHLGIPMGAPAFKYRQLFKQHGVVQFSANFELYGDISKRITQLLTSVTPMIEVYSVDESFLDLSQLSIADYDAWGREVAARINRYVGVPVSIGIAPTKTLAKLASDRAKKIESLRGALYIEPGSEVYRSHTEALPIEDIWGVGRRQAPKLRAYGVTNAAELADLPPRLARQLLGGVRGEQLARELQGTSCLPIELETRVAKSISRTRTFGQDTMELRDLESAIVGFTARAAYRLRHSGQVAQKAGLFLTSSRHKPDYRRWSRETRLDPPTSDTGRLASRLVGLLGELYMKDIEYHRAGVLLYDFIPADQLQSDILGIRDFHDVARSRSRMRAVDDVNSRYGRQSLHYASEDLSRNWQPRRRLQSPRYTSQWDELPVATIES